MSQLLLAGRNSKAIAEHEAERARNAARLLITALESNERGDREKTSLLVIEAMGNIVDVQQIADLVSKGRADEALAIIDKQRIKGGKV